jgi:hypothetical protein
MRLLRHLIRATASIRFEPRNRTNRPTRDKMVRRLAAQLQRFCDQQQKGDAEGAPNEEGVAALAQESSI